MPYVIREEDGKFCLHKADSDEMMGCHDSRAEAQAQMAAMYASEKAGRETLFMTPAEPDPPPQGEDDPALHEVPDDEGKTTPEAEENAPLPESAGDAPNHEPPPEEEDKQWAEVAVGNLPVPQAMASDEGDPAFWEQTETKTVSAGGYVPNAFGDGGWIIPSPRSEVVHLSNGTTKISDFPNSKVININIEGKPLGAKRELVKALDDLLDKFKLKRKPDHLTDLKVVGNHWFMSWSNNFADRDKEIFTEKAIKRYVARTDAGITPLPELWVWHVGKQVRIGEAEMVGYHDHFLLAAGTFDATPQAQKARDYYEANAHKTRVSHGYAYPPDQFDGKHYHEFNTFEISLLPRGVEANLFTSLEGVKAMALKPDQIKYLEEVFGKEYVKTKLGDLTERGKALEELGVEYKDFSDVTPSERVMDEGTKALLSDLLEDTATAVSAATAALKAVKQVQSEFSVIKADFAGRPRKASEAPETELTEANVDARMREIRESVAAQSRVVHKFWNTEEEVGV